MIHIIDIDIENVDSESKFIVPFQRESFHWLKETKVRIN